MELDPTPLHTGRSQALMPGMRTLAFSGGQGPRALPASCALPQNSLLPLVHALTICRAENFTGADWKDSPGGAGWKDDRLQLPKSPSPSLNRWRPGGIGLEVQLQLVWRERRCRNGAN